MIVIPAIAALIASALAASASAQPAPQPEAGGAASEIVTADVDRYSRLTVPVTIEGKGPFRFMVDTGSQATVVTRTLRDRLDLPRLGQATVIGMAGSKQVDLVRLDGLEFAARVFDALHAPLLEAQHIGADGILGLDSLQDLRVMIDFRDQTIAVDDARRLGGDKGYEIVVRARNKLGRLIIADAMVENVKTAVIIDTGAQGSVGNRALQRRLRAHKGTEVISTDVTGASLVGEMVLARKIEIGSGGRSMGIENVPISYADAPAFAALGLADRPALVLGMDDLRSFDRVAIDFSRRTVLFDLPRNAGRAGA